MLRKNKPAKPTADFPLTPHSSGKWCKKIRGKIYYFGSWDDPQGAMAEYLEQRDYLLAGKEVPTGGHTLFEVLDRFMQSRSKDLATGEIAQRTWDDYKDNCDLILRLYNPKAVVEQLGPEDLQDLRTKLFDGVNPTTAGNRIRMAKTAIRYIETIVPKFRMDFGKWFAQPSAKVKRKARVEGGKKLHTALQIRTAVESANPAMKAILLLGINCAFGNSDCGRLQWEHLDLEGGWHDYHREKTYIERRAKLWPETIQSLSCLSEDRSGGVFSTKYGNKWSSTAISHEASKLGIEFYSLRRTFRTVADATRETMAIHLIMGHAKSGSNMDHVYVQEVVDPRLEFVSEYVRAWYLK